jgi:hypothetical protein
MRRMSKTGALVAIAILLALGVTWWIVSPRDSARSPNPGAAGRVRDELPSSWSLEEIAKETPPYGCGPEGVYVLAWRIREDAHLRSESCLVMRVLEKDDGHGRWCLAHLYRHPNGKDPKWRLSTIHVTGAKGTKYFTGMWIHHAMRFKEQPTNKTLYAALSDRIEGVSWSFEPERDFPTISAGVCEQNWQKVTGEKPTRFFRP